MEAELAMSDDDLQKFLDGAAFNRAYNFKIHSFAAGECTLIVPFQKNFERPGGLISGPVFIAAADAAMWLAIIAQLGTDDIMSVTTEMKTSFLNTARQEDFLCTARILKLGKRLIYGVAECSNTTGKLLTHHTITYIRPEK